MKNNTVSQIESPGRRAAAYWFEDGLAEIYFGLLILAMVAPGVAHAFHLLNLPTILNWWVRVLFVLIFIGVSMILLLKDRQILDFFKSRLTYSRTGYARPPEIPAPGQDALFDYLTPDQRWAKPITLGSARSYSENVTGFKARTLGSFLFATYLGFLGVRERWTVAILMVFVAVLVYTLNRREAHPYSKWSVLPIALAGLFSAAVEIPPRGRIFIPLVIGGGWLLARGGWALMRYLRAHPRSQALQRDRL